MNWYKQAFAAPDDVQYVSDYYETEGAKELAHKFKEGDPDAIETMAVEMAHRIPDDAILIPVPSRSGIATDTKVLAERIKDIRGGSVQVEDIVVGKERMSLYDLKKSKVPIPKDLFGFSINKVPQGNVYLVDNVYNTGATAKEIQKLIPHAQVLVYAYSEPKAASNKSWYKKAELNPYGFQKGQKLTYTKKSGYRGWCTVEEINEDGSLSVIDHTGRRMSKFKPVQMGMNMFEEMQ